MSYQQFFNDNEPGKHDDAIAIIGAIILIAFLIIGFRYARCQDMQALQDNAAQQ